MTNTTARHAARTPRTDAAPARRTLVRVARAVAYGFAFLLPPAVVGALGVNAVMARVHSQPEPFAAAAPVPEHAPELPTVAVLLSNVWTELADFLAPYEIFAASGAFNVYAVAPERALTPLNGVLDVLPHYTIAEFEAAGHQPDVVVVPYVADIHGSANQPLLAYIAAQAERGATILSICAGAEVVAAAGVLEGRRATTIWSRLTALESAYPATEWVHGQRYVDDGSVVSSAGVTAGIDASLYLLGRIAGPDLARRVAAGFDYPHTRFLDDPRQETDYSMVDLAPMALHAAYGWDRPSLGVALEEGVHELELAALLEIHTAAVADVVTLADARRPVRTAHGLHVVPRATFDGAGALDRIVVPGSADGGYSFDAMVLDLARREDRGIASATAASLEYPIGHLELEGPATAHRLLARALLLGVAGLGAAFLLEGVLRRRRVRAPRAARHARAFDAPSTLR